METHLVVDALVQVLDENIALTRLSQSRITLRPHDPAWPVLDQRVVEMLQSPLAVSGVEVIDIGVTERSSRDSISTDSNSTISRADNRSVHSRSNGSDHVEDLEQHSLRDAAIQFTDVEAGSRAGCGSGTGSRLSGRIGSSSRGSAGCGGRRGGGVGHFFRGVRRGWARVEF